MVEVNELAVAAGGAGARTGLRAALALRRLAERLEALQVINARQQGWSWQEIADALEVSKQAVHQKHAARAAASVSNARTETVAPSDAAPASSPASGSHTTSGSGTGSAAPARQESTREV